MHKVHQCTHNHSLLLAVIFLPATSNLPQHPPNQAHIKTNISTYTKAHAYLTWPSNHQIIKAIMHPKQKTLATGTNRLCALHSRTYDSPSQRQQNSSKSCLRRTSQPLSHRHHKNRTLHPPIPIQSLGFTKGACGYSVSALRQWCLRRHGWEKGRANRNLRAIGKGSSY
ncbi:hypothetical protein J3E68DRAFT_125903 [Trichoderma sp. SZMC 28012]